MLIIDWNRISTLGAEFLKALQTVPMGGSCYDSVLDLLEGVLHWVDASRQLQEELVHARQDPEEQLRSSDGLHVAESSQDHKESVLVSVGCQTDEQEPQALPDVKFLRLVAAPPLPYVPWEVEDLREEWREWFGVQRTILGYLTYLGDHGFNPRIKKRYPPHLFAIHEKVHQLLKVDRPQELPAGMGWKGCKERTPSPDIQTRPDYRSAEDLYRRAIGLENARKAFRKTVDQGRSRVPFWVAPEEWPAWKWDPVKGKHMKVRFEDEPVEDKPYWCPEHEWFNWKRDPALGWVPIPLEEMDQVYAEHQQRQQEAQSQRLKHERDAEDATEEEGESSEMARKRVRLAIDTSKWTDVIIIE